MTARFEKRWNRVASVSKGSREKDEVASRREIPLLLWILWRRGRERRPFLHSQILEI